MPNYLAFLGHQPHISLAELAAVIPDFHPKCHVTTFIVLFTTEETLNQSTLNRLGGTIILAEERECCPFNPKTNPLKNFLVRVPPLLGNELRVRKRGKVTFSLRTEGVPRPLVKALYRASKLLLKGQGRPCRYVGNERKPAFAALLHDAKLIGSNDGCEIVIVIGESFVWIGRTVAAQNVSAYAHRDMEKPVRDLRSGLLPPKLAQIMLNFGKWLTKKEHMTVYDPFCGTGVIPMEALLKGFDVLASDKSQKAVNATEKNIDWLRKEYKIFKKDVASRVWKQDATKPPALEKNEGVDVIVTETTLGPPLEHHPSQKDVKKWRAENERIQEAFLTTVATCLPNTPIACIWPVWYTKMGPVFLEKTWKAVDKAGLQPVLPEGTEWNARCSLPYRRPDQFVGREIVLLKPKEYHS